MLRDLQKSRIKQFLSPNKDFFWKVLILDSHTKDILSPLLKLNELRDLGIATYFNIITPRNKIKEVPAIYFIQPTPENYKIIKEDIIKQLYNGYYLNFTTTIDRDSLEDLAYSLSNQHLGFHVQSVFDQFIDFIPLQNNLFVLNHESSYERVENNFLIKSTVNSLFSVFVTMDEIPFIITRNNNTVLKSIADMVNTKLRNTNIIKKTSRRPLLVLLDRNFDIFTPFEHVWSYNALINDFLSFKLNKVIVDDKSYELDPNDEFWKANQNEYFPVVAEKIEKELLEHKKEMALRSIDDRTDKKKIEEILERAPELARKNESIQAHMAICLKLVEMIKKRSTDDFYRLEKSKFKNNELLEVSEKGESEDILRLAISLKNENEEIVKALLKKRGIDDKILNYISKFKDQTSHKNNALYSKVASTILGNVKKLLPVNVECPIYREIENLFNNIKNSYLDDYHFCDPLRGDTFYENEISSIFVFQYGGGTYNEYNSLINLEKKLGVDIFYGSSEMLNAKEFIKQVGNK